MARYKAPAECTGVSLGAKEFATETGPDKGRYLTVPDDMAHEELLAQGFERVSEAQAPVFTRRRRG